MSTHEHSEHEDQKKGNFLWSRAGLVLVGFLIIAGALLFTEHRAHVIGVLIWLPLLACPLMHIFMHGGHGSHGTHGTHGQSSREGRPS